MREVLYLAWRYLAFNRGKTAVLVASIMLIVYLPVALRVLVAQSAAELTARAEATPLLVGARGSALELALNSLYFESAPPERTRYAEALRVSNPDWRRRSRSTSASRLGESPSSARRSTTSTFAGCASPPAGQWPSLASASSAPRLPRSSASESATRWSRLRRASSTWPGSIR